MLIAISKAIKRLQLTQKMEKLLEKESGLHLCVNSCYSACPVMEINSSFLGPLALVRAYEVIFLIRGLRIQKRWVDGYSEEWILGLYPLWRV